MSAAAHREGMTTTLSLIDALEIAQGCLNARAAGAPADVTPYRAVRFHLTNDASTDLLRRAFDLTGQKLEDFDSDLVAV